MPGAYGRTGRTELEGTLMSADLAHISALFADSGLTTAPRNRGAEGRHLHPAALPQWRALLEFGWQERLERITALSLAYHEAAETADAGARTAAGVGIETRARTGARDDDSKESAARRAARQRADRLLHRTVAERRALADIEAALARLAVGRFGWCEQCGGAISTARLAQTPQITYCATCSP